MKILYLDLSMGAAGDMLTAALLELLPDPEAFVEKLNGLGLPDVEFRREKVTKCGIQGTHIAVMVHGREEEEWLHQHKEEKPHDHGHGHGHDHDHVHQHSQEPESGQPHKHDHPHRSLKDIEHIVKEHLNLPEPVLDDVLAVYETIAEAESAVHGSPVEHIHFHEVGSLDAIADVTAVCLLMNELAPDQVVASPVCVGHGQVVCAHGVLPVPAPATGHLLEGVPVYGGEIEGELCTPTGAALIRHFVDRFDTMPLMQLEKTGYGMGSRDYPRANCLRAVLGRGEKLTDQVLELSCNVDDMTAERIGFAMERLFEGGAREVYTIPIGMKKSRPGTMIRVLCSEQDREKMLELLFRHTTTIGVRESSVKRTVLDRREESQETPYGPVRKKISEGFGVRRTKFEYSDLVRIAKDRDMSLEEVERMLEGS